MYLTFTFEPSEAFFLDLLVRYVGEPCEGVLDLVAFI